MLASGKSSSTVEQRVSGHIVLSNSNFPLEKYEKWKKGLEELGKYDLATILQLP